MMNTTLCRLRAKKHPDKKCAVLTKHYKIVIRIGIQINELRKLCTKLELLGKCKHYYIHLKV